jgi:hypothetical protein
MISCSPTSHTALLLVIPSCSTAQHALAVSSGSWKLALINGRLAAPQQALTTASRPILSNSAAELLINAINQEN